MDVAGATVTPSRPNSSAAMYSFVPKAGEIEGKLSSPAAFGQSAESVLRPAPSSLQTLLALFQTRYPTASLVAELLMIHEGNYVVRALVQIGGTPLVSGMAAAPDIELAEDRAKVRALETLALQPTAPQSSLSPSAYELQVRLMTPTNPPEMPSGAMPLQYSEDVPQLPVDLSQSDSYSETYSEPYEDTEVSSSLPPDEPLIEDLLPPVEVETKIKPASKRNEAGGTTKLAPATPALEPLPELDLSSSTLTADIPSSEPSYASSTTDLSDVIAQTTVELKRLGWSNAKGRDHLEQTYGKRSRQQLTDAELLDFLHYLQSQSSPNQAPF